jgi:predicted DNA-binding transcriptional regulator AlpA
MRSSSLISFYSGVVSDLLKRHETMPIPNISYISCISLRTRYTSIHLEVERDVMGKGKSDPQAPNQTAFVDMRELLHRWPVSRATVYRTIKRGELAPPVRISERRVAWPKATIEQFLRDFVMAELGKR